MKSLVYTIPGLVDREEIGAKNVISSSYDTSWRTCWTRYDRESVLCLSFAGATHLSENPLSTMLPMSQRSTKRGRSLSLSQSGTSVGSERE